MKKHRHDVSMRLPNFHKLAFLLELYRSLSFGWSLLTAAEQEQMHANGSSGVYGAPSHVIPQSSGQDGKLFRLIL